MRECYINCFVLFCFLNSLEMMILRIVVILLFIVLPLQELRLRFSYFLIILSLQIKNLGVMLYRKTIILVFMKDLMGILI